LSYQWYLGLSGETDNPIEGATDVTYTTPPLTVTTSYWVRVTNTVGSVDSQTATITVSIQPPAMTITLGTLPGGQGVVLTVPVVPGYDSVVEYTDTLPPLSGWTPLPGSPHNTGSLTLSIDGTVRYYRIAFLKQ
jgi:hypothetical protein